MQTIDANDFGNKLSAAMANMSSEDYIERNQMLLANLDKVETLARDMKLEVLADYPELMKWKGMVSSLQCFTFNNKLAEDERVRKLESFIGNRLARFIKRFLAPAEDNLLIRYVLWRKHFVGDDEFRKWVFRQLILRGYIYVVKMEKRNAYYVRGIQCKVRDNVTRIDRMGRERYCFYNVCVLQAFELEQPNDISYLATFENIPELPDYLEQTYMATDNEGGKHSAQHPKITDKELRKLKAMWDGLRERGELNF